MLFRTNQGICPRVFFDLKLQTLKPGTKMFKNLQMYRICYTKYDSMCFTRIEKLTPLLGTSGIFTSSTELTINDCLWSPLEHVSPYPASNGARRIAPIDKLKRVVMATGLTIKCQMCVQKNCHLLKSLTSTHRVDL